ncbi:hypothetical protein ACXIUT_03360 [Achromobacter denitrificans]
MHVTVLLAGVADPRKPLPKPASGDWRDLPAEPSVSYKLSPFDEAALEIALKLRDQGAASRVTAIVTDGARDLALLRAVAALKPDRVQGLWQPAAQRGNPLWLARHAPALLCEGGNWPDLILIGREHGDLDDGMAPAYLAQAWGLPYVGLALQVRARPEGGWTLLRSGARQDEELIVPAPAMASISNDKSNRLRHPLMKNVALAKQLSFDQATPDAALPLPGATLLRAAPAEAAARGGQACKMFTGPVQAQAEALAAYLRAPRAAHS